MPPTLKRMFLPAAEVNRTIRTRSRQCTASSVWFGHLVTPSGGRTFPIVYLEALLAGTTGRINQQTVRVFNASATAIAALDQAKAEFERRTAERQQLSPFNGLLTPDDVAWLLGTSLGPVHQACNDGTLPLVASNVRKLIRPDDLRARCTWVLKTR